MFAPTILGSGLAGYSYLARTREDQQARLEQSPQVRRDTQYTLDKLASVDSAEALMEDRTLLRVVLGAFGLDEDIDNRAFLLRILESDLSDSRSLANRLADKRYLAFAKTFNFTGDTAALPDGRAPDRLREDLAGIRTADDLLKDTSLLRATLTTFGLEGDIGNTYFLKQVLESDPADPASFVNRLGDPRYADLAEAFGFTGKSRASEGIYGLAEQFLALGERPASAAELLDEPNVLRATLDLFGLRADQYRTGFLTSVLESDLDDPLSFANTQSDPRYAALARAFDFHGVAAAQDAAEAAALAGDPPPPAFVSRMDRFLTVMESRLDTPVKTPKDFFSDPRLMLATYDLFDLPSRTDKTAFAARILDSDPSDPTSLVNSVSDPRYRAFRDGFSFEPEQQGRVYPPGFAEAVVANYLDRQFEISVGNADPAMRSALSVGRELEQLVKNTTTNDARWFGVMASKALRDVFETALRLPSNSFGQLDVDRQLGDFKDRARQVFGTDTLADFAKPDMLDRLRRSYVVQKTLLENAPQGPANVVLTLLGGG